MQGRKDAFERIDTEFQNLLAQLEAAWNEANGQDYAACFADHASYVAFDGSVLVGAAQIGQVHDELFHGFLKGSKMRFEEVELVQRVSDTMAVLVTRGSVQLPSKGPQAGRLSRQTMTLVRSDRSQPWKVVAFQNVRIQNLNLIFRLFLKITGQWSLYQKLSPKFLARDQNVTA